ncbi:response regulator transcription factor [Actinoallomurus sp. NPDC050550]|uniref:response regulator transcription factor n=1 Tax=Actinoallomurus sp. NPDC050550 TaxID=3154937 RepID=UPI0033FDFDF7
MIRVAIVDDHPIARWGIEHVFASRDLLDVVAAVAEPAELAGPPTPDVVLLDLYLREGRPALEAIRDLSGRCRVLVLSASSRRFDVLAALRAGASGYLTKDAPEDVLVEALRTVHDGGFYLSPHLADMLAEAPHDARPRLTAREEEALRWVAEGFTHAQAARRMGISVWTFETHLRRVRAKFGIGNTAELTRFLLERDPRED